jgi:transcriptional regulator with XRE-family HTH domain
MPTLRELRADRLLRIRELAQQAGVAPSSLYLIETRRATPRMAIIRRIARALVVDPETVEEFQLAIEAAKEPHPRRGRTASR